MKATDAYRKINNSPIKGIVLYYTEQILKMDKVALGSVIEQIQTGKTPPKANAKYYSSSDVNWFKPSDIGYEKYLEEADEKFSNIAVKEKKATIYPKDTLLLIGIGGGVGRVSILKEKGSSNQQITGITFNEKVCPQYAYYYYLVREDYIKSQAKSMSFPILNQSKIKELEFRYPSIPEQNEFVKFIDTCWNSFLNNEIPDISSFEISPELKEYALIQFKAIELDDKIQKNIVNELKLLSKFKQSILQEAIQGKLTADWRKQNPNTEPASELLKRIKAEKDQLIKDKKIKEGKKQASIDLGKIQPRIPSNWIYSDLDDITQFVTDGTHQTPTYTETGRMFLSAQNVKPFKFMPENHKYISESAYEECTKGKKPELGDLLVGRVGSKGETAVIDQKLEFAYYVSLGFIKTFKNLTNPDYLAIVMNSPYGNQYATGNMSSIGASAGNYNLGRMRSFPIPFPPLEEQKAIVEKVETLMQKCQTLEQEIKTCEANAQMLMQAVLKEAFEGKKEEVYES